jgi:DNA-damage-inducible protein D
MTNKSLPVRGNISFEELKKLNEHGAEFWSARELQHLLGDTANGGGLERLLREA